MIEGGNRKPLKRSKDTTGVLKKCEDCLKEKDLGEFSLVKNTHRDHYEVPERRKKLCRPCDVILSNKNKTIEQSKARSFGFWTCLCGKKELKTRSNCLSCGMPRED